ncbi:hypothetical protein JG536_28155 (plasmid) [Burkholderia ambifaria]|uniref:VPA1269 family protein n=1 Tax=Burkholderia ambifaria TaxID=152480 RepID=UPI0018F698FF|nr:VPA1269 family protein [Burkholderia ambifaria]QQK01076.1 hypothetical protein JG536_28155 [Burkholderia ambifaria]
MRSIQARRLDSGEGDELKYCLDKKEWNGNDSLHARHWKQVGARNCQRGVLRRIVDTWTGEVLCGFYINSNKVKDRAVNFSEHSGYVISWQYEEVIDIMIKMRAWQERYNAVSGPLALKDVRQGVFALPSKSVSELKVDCFYLFRYPGGLSGNWNASPPTSQQLRMFWLEVLGELERRLALTMENPPKFIESWKGGSPQASCYTLHGMRVGGLTRLANAGVNPWILQNIVAGHADWVMTLYYISPNPSMISQSLTEAYYLNLKNKQDEFQLFLTEKSIERVHRASVARSEDAYDALRKIKSTNTDLAMAILDHGICPNCQTRCDEGMSLYELIVNGKGNKNSYGPVPRLRNGVPDCSQCRFFITGTPFAFPLHVKINEIGLSIHSAMRRKGILLEELDSLNRLRVRAEREGERMEVRDVQRQQSLKYELGVQSEVLASLALSFNAHANLFEGIRRILSSEVNDSIDEVSFMVKDVQELSWQATPRFEALHDVCQCSRWFASVDTFELSRERRETIIRMFARQKEPVPLALLSEKEADTAAEAVSTFLFKILTRGNVEHLVQGRKTFAELGILGSVRELAGRERSAAIGPMLSES